MVQASIHQTNWAYDPNKKPVPGALCPISVEYFVISFCRMRRFRPGWKKIRHPWVRSAQKTGGIWQPLNFKDELSWYMWNYLNINWINLVYPNISKFYGLQFTRPSILSYRIIQVESEQVVWIWPPKMYVEPETHMTHMTHMGSSLVYQCTPKSVASSSFSY
jgi:hypothetical protein